MQAPRIVKAAHELLTNAGHEAFLVGGCVRDLLRKTAPHDWDMATSATPDEMVALFSSSGWKLHTGGLKHGTLLLVRFGTHIEITTYRIDGEYSDGRRPDSVAFTEDLVQDLARRDFTVNAMALWAGELVDPFGGCADLRTKTIRCVGCPDKRFGEDGLRILRALRFSSTLGFTIEPGTLDAAIALREMLVLIAVERVRNELEKILGGRNLAYVLDKTAPVIAAVLPELSGSLENGRYAFLCRAVVSAPPRLRLTLLLCELDPDALSGALTRLLYGKKRVERMLLLVEYLHQPIPEDMVGFKRLLGMLEYGFFELLELKRCVALTGGHTPEQNLNILRERAKELFDKRCCLRRSQLAVRGDDLIAAGVTEGSEVGEILEAMLVAVLSERLPNRKKALLRAYREKKL